MRVLRFLSIFRLKDDLDSFETIIKTIRKGVEFRGTNLWILAFAIFVASIGLNVNSTAVIIGAMLISPLMGPIMGVGLGIGINDLQLIKNAAKNFSYAIIVSVATSAIYFSISPLREATSEILLRTTPTIWDVLIAFFGGMAGIITTSSKDKGNILPGVAIATALMPPLCTAGFGLAHLQWNFFVGALYLFLINSVFIAFATGLTVRLLKFPLVIFTEKAQERYVKRWIFISLLVFIAPSIFIGYKIVQQNKFLSNANRFIEMEATISQNYLLDKTIDAANSTITLTYGGKGLSKKDKAHLQNQLRAHNLENATLTIVEGINTSNANEIERTKQKYIGVIDRQELDLINLQKKVDSLEVERLFKQQMIREAKSILPSLTNLSVSPLYSSSNYSPIDSSAVIYITVNVMPNDSAKTNFKNWFTTKLNAKDVHLIVELDSLLFKKK